jgi:hypothetical protein
MEEGRFMNIKKIEVGKPLFGSYKKMQEGVKFELNENSFELYMFFNNPSKVEIQEITKGNPVLGGVTLINGVIIPIFKFGKMLPQESMFSIHLLKNQIIVLEDCPDKLGYKLVIYLVDAMNSEVKGIRMISLGNEFSKQLKALIFEQMNQTFNVENYKKSISEITKTYSVMDLYKLTTIHNLAKR